METVTYGGKTSGSKELREILLNMGRIDGNPEFELMERQAERLTQFFLLEEAKQVDWRPLGTALRKEAAPRSWMNWYD